MTTLLMYALSACLRSMSSESPDSDAESAMSADAEFMANLYSVTRSKVDQMIHPPTMNTQGMCSLVFEPR